MNAIPDPGNLQPAPVPSSAVLPKPRFKRVGGWLLVFCLALTVLAPLMAIWDLTKAVVEASRYSGPSPGLSLTDVPDVFDALLSAGLVASGMYVGIRLWGIRPGAVQTAKRYLWCFLGYHVVSAFLRFTIALPAALTDAATIHTLGALVRGVIKFAVWYAYLEKSVRVRGTYPS